MKTVRYIDFNVTNTFTLTLSTSTVSAVEMHICSTDAMQSDHEKCKGSRNMNIILMNFLSFVSMLFGTFEAKNLTGHCHLSLLKI